MAKGAEPCPDGHTRSTLFSGCGVRVVDFRCRAHVEPLGKEEPNPTHSIVFIRRGVFARKDREGTFVADPTHILFFNEGQPYRYAHPLPGGDECTILTLDEETARAAVERLVPHRVTKTHGPFPAGHGLLTMRAARLHHELLGVLSGDRTGSDLTAQDLVAELMDEAVAALHRSNVRSETRPPRSRWRELADAAKVMLSESIDDPPSLIDLAARLDCSPFHLSRVFRRTTGLTLRGYIRRLRAALAADRLRRGEDDLTSLALDLGFCDHSHFTNSFRREWGVTPSRVRPAAVRRGRQTERSR